MYNIVASVLFASSKNLRSLQLNSTESKLKFSLLVRKTG